MPTREAIEWCDQNMHNQYPLADSATGVSTSGVILPQSFLVDMQLVVPTIATTSNVRDNFFISSIERVGDSFQIYLGYRTGADASYVVCGKSGLIPSTIRNTTDLDERTVAIYPILDASYAQSVLSPLLDLEGQFIVGSCVDMLNMGSLTFGYNATKLLGLRVYIVANGINSITVVDSDGVQHTLTRDFVLQPGDGIDVSVDPDYVDPVSLRIMPKVTFVRTRTAAEEESGFNSISDVLSALSLSDAVPVRSINLISPDADGNITIEGLDCVGMKSLEHGISITNTCSKPCCDASSISDVSANLEQLMAAHTRIATYYDSIMANINAMQARLSSIIMSRKSMQQQNQA